MSESGSWLDVDQVLERVYQAPEGEREAVLEEACGGNAELRAEVESLLSHVAPSESLFSGMAATLQPEVGPGGAHDGDDVVGARIGRYRLETLLPGGMSRVFRAWDESAERWVVVKVARKERDPAAEQRLEREGEAVETIRHPNICQVIERGRTEDGRPFLVLEYCDGETLAAAAARGPCEPLRMASVGRQVGLALAVAHANGVIHRDIKPGNVMVSSEGTVKLLDFGSAKTGDKPLTKLGMVVGTPVYMSPEQVQGQSLTPATDVWSLGVLLHECVAGAHPFEGGSRRRTLMNILHQRPAPLTSEGPASVNTDLARVIGSMLSKEPGARPTAEQVAWGFQEVQRRLGLAAD